MTILGAKRIGEKWNLFADDCVSLGETKISAVKNYRSKIRELPRAKNFTICSSAGTCRETDLIINLLDKALSNKLYDNELELLDIIQDVIVEGCKLLKEIDEDVARVNLFLLDVDLQACYLIEEFSVRLLTKYVECVCGCGQDIFYKLHKNSSSYGDFITDFVKASELDDGCALPVYKTDGESVFVYGEGSVLIDEYKYRKYKETNKN